MLLGQKVTERSSMRCTLPQGVDHRSACAPSDWTGPDDLAIKIEELREITHWEIPIYMKVGATGSYYDVKLRGGGRRHACGRRRHAGRHSRHPDISIEHTESHVCSVRLAVGGTSKSSACTGR